MDEYVESKEFIDWLEDKKISIRKLIESFLYVEIYTKQRMIDLHKEFNYDKLNKLVDKKVKSNPDFAYWYAKYKEEVK